ncbi:hypothetical protein AGMMS49928_23110 [Spirochaetia bacterium]|nr:hypothetical protein AGMMS49928_23110 [Spirochaetia bacterium]
MKRTIFFVLIFWAAVSAFAQVNLPEHRFASGAWTIAGSRVYQNDTKARLAKVNLRVAQNGPMLYEFDVRYEDGAEDGHGGFGIHIFADTVYNGASWGCGNSYLLWLNYDENPRNPAIPKGFSAQIYRSRTNSRMDLVDSIDINEYAESYLLGALDNPIPVKIHADGNTGEVRVYDPSDPEGEIYYFFTVDQKDIPLKGNWAAVRTNGIKLSFATE